MENGRQPYDWLNLLSRVTPGKREKDTKDWVKKKEKREKEETVLKLFEQSLNC